MAISFVGSSVNSSSPNTGTVVDITGGPHQSGDLLIVAAAVGDTANNGMLAPTDGSWSRVPGVAATLYSNDANDVNLDLYYKIASGSETTISFGARGGTNASNAAVVMAFRGVDNTTPFDVNATTATGIDTSNADPPSIDHGNPSGVWVVIAGATGHTGGATAAFTFPTGYTTNAAQRAHNDTIDVLVGLGYRTNPSDPENPGPFSAANIGTASGNAWAAVTMALRPAIPIVEGDGAAAGVAASSVIGSAVWATSQTIAGIATVTGAGEDASGPTIVEADGAAAGVASVTGAVAAIAASVQASAGTGSSVVAAVALWVGQVVSAGVAAITGAVSSVVAAVSASLGLGASSGEGLAIGPVEADAVSVGTVSVLGDGDNAAQITEPSGVWKSNSCHLRLHAVSSASHRSNRVTRRR